MSRTFKTDYQALSTFDDETNDDELDVPPSHNVVQIHPDQSRGQSVLYWFYHSSVGLYGYSIHSFFSVTCCYFDSLLYAYIHTYIITFIVPSHT